MKILLLAPHPFYQARGTPIAVRTVLEFLSERGDTVDVLTYAEGSEVSIPNCTVHRIPRVPGLQGIRPGFSVKKVLSDVLMVGSCLRLVRRTRYDLIHAVEESAFIAAAMRALTGVPYVYDMDSSLAEQLVDAYPPLRFAFSVLRRMEAVAIRRSSGVLAVCAALEDVALAHAPGQLVGRVEDTTLLTGPRPAGGNGRGLPPSDGPDGDVRRQPRVLSGDRSPARGLPPHAQPGAAGEAGDRGRTGARRSRTIAAGRSGSGSTARSSSPVLDPSACCPSSCGRRTSSCRPGSRASTPR